MHPAFRPLFVCAAACLAATLTLFAGADVDAIFKAFWDAPSPRDAARIAPDIVASGVSFDEALRRFKAGRSYSAMVKTGVLATRYRAPNGLEFYYALNVPKSYDPARKYQVRIHLHGGVSRETNGVRGDGSIGALAGAEQIYILPYAWIDAPWWADSQLENLRTILDMVKRTYNVDENRVALAGVSDGGTGAYYVAMRDTTPYASFLPLNGFIKVLSSVTAWDLFPNNLRNKPFFVVNGGKDPLYPTRVVEPSVVHLKTRGVEVDYRPQPNAVHNTAWWPQVAPLFEAFVTAHPRNPLPDRLTWQSTASRADSRANWLIVDRLGPRNAGDAPLEDVNDLGANGATLFSNTDVNGRVDLIRAANTVRATTRGVSEFTLLLSPDVFDFTKPVRIETNGRLAFEGQVEKSVETLAKWAARDNDRTMLFAAELHVTVR
jgi:poly(3-hydroxybutyrate) depolymerase